MTTSSIAVGAPAPAPAPQAPAPPPPSKTLVQLARALFHPLLIFDAYTFRWLTFDPHDEEHNQEQAFTKVTNHIALALASGSLGSGVILLVLSVIDSVLLLLAVNDAEDDHHATILLRKLGLWFTLPALYFYLGVLIGTFGCFLWVPAVFPMTPALFVMAIGFVLGIPFNAGYYLFIVLFVYEARAECGMSVPGPPALLARLLTCGRKAPKVAHGVILTAEVAVDTSANSADRKAEATRILELSLLLVGRADLLHQLVDDEWDHLDALMGLEESHATQQLGLKPGAAVRFVRHLRQQLKLAQESNKSLPRKQ
ncbi:hypothetical protein Gpo141_00000346 [Globisporangium polare]